MSAFTSMIPFENSGLTVNWGCQQRSAFFLSQCLRPSTVKGLDTHTLCGRLGLAESRYNEYNNCPAREQSDDQYTARRPSTGFQRWAINLRFHSLVHGDSVAKFALWNARMTVL